MTKAYILGVLLLMSSSLLAQVNSVEIGGLTNVNIGTNNPAQYSATLYDANGSEYGFPDEVQFAYWTVSGPAYYNIVSESNYLEVLTCT